MGVGSSKTYVSGVERTGGASGRPGMMAGRQMLLAYTLICFIEDA